jgi:hypothetical protein
MVRLTEVRIIETWMFEGFRSNTRSNVNYKVSTARQPGRAERNAHEGERVVLDHVLWVEDEGVVHKDGVVLCNGEVMHHLARLHTSRTL